MLIYLTLIFLCQFIGESLTRLLGLPIPGPVIGMALLLGFLLLRGDVPDGLERAAGGLLQNMALLFVPVSVGIMQLYPLLLEDWLPLAVALVVSTLVALVLVAVLLERLLPPPEPGAEDAA